MFHSLNKKEKDSGAQGIEGYQNPITPLSFVAGAKTASGMVKSFKNTLKKI